MIGQTIAHYTITAKIGEGGMGQVYRATDTKLKREVALKILPESFSDDPQRMGRFQREAEALASLNHPNIAAIYGLEKEGELHAIAMELVEGETLAERIRRSAIPTEEALQIALPITLALEAAHEKGIIHRDLKPANVIVTPDGKAKVLDFGLAKAVERESPAGSAELTQSPTLTMQATQAGMILGTAAYMSPEQAKGKPVDKRADIWAFGAVLFEILTGSPAFGGSDITEVLAAVVMKDPDWERLPEDLPATVRRVLLRCLDREARSRLRDIGEARIAIERYLGNPAEAVEGARRTQAPPVWKQPAAIMIALTMLFLGIAAAWLFKPVPEQPLRKMLWSPNGLTLDWSNDASSVPPTISPDGNKLVYQAQGQLWIKFLDRLEVEPLADSSGAARPFFSFDSAYLAYTQNGKLWKVNLSSRAKTALCDLPAAFLGGSWAADGTIVFGSQNGLYEVSAQGGDPKLVLETDRTQRGAGDLNSPQFLPGKRATVFSTGGSGGSQLQLFSDGQRTTLLAEEGIHFFEPHYSASGHLIFERWGGNNGLWAIPFSASSFRITGQPFVVDPEGSWPSISNDGRLVYFRGHYQDQRQLTVVDRSGQAQGTIGQPQPNLRVWELSPDGKRVAVVAEESAVSEVWVHDVQSGSKRRLSEGFGIRPTWTASGDRVVFHRGGEIWSRPADGSGHADKLTDGYEPDFSADGRYLVFLRSSAKAGSDLWYLETENNEPKSLLASEEEEFYPQLSPDSRWIAYGSEHSGQRQLFVRQFPSGEGRLQISSDGGTSQLFPKWSPAGDELFYVNGQGVLMVVSVRALETFDFDDPRALFEMPVGFPEYDLMDGGEHFMISSPVSSDGPPASIAIVDNWLAEFRQR